jgi:urea transport system permease protein
MLDFLRLRVRDLAKTTVLVAGLISFIFTASAQEAGAPSEEQVRAKLVEIINAESGSDAQLQSIAALADTGLDVVAVVLEGWRKGEIVNQGGTLILKGEKESVDVATGKPATVTDGKAVDTPPSKVRRAIRSTLDLLSLSSPKPAVRASSAIKLGQTQNAANLPILEARKPKEKDKSVLKALDQGISLIQVAGTDKAVRIAAIEKLAELNSLPAVDTIKKLASDPDQEVAAAAKQAEVKLLNYIRYVDFLGTIFRGLSTGSILLVVALGLAITFGLMGVINMAHGEIMVVGAYTTYFVQGIFGGGIPLPLFGLSVNIPGMKLEGAALDLYFIAALPAAFLVAAIVGIALERGIIQFLYKRPLESLLATWGVSMCLQQCFRLVFGPNNVQVYSPAWLSGNWTVSDVILGWNRLFVIAFAIVIVLLTYLLLTRTPLGLLIRAVMQNRQMASCMGVKAENVNMLTFGFGSGLAGLAGAFLSQIGNVGPALGQDYIVSCFMTVVVGGVGNIVGTIISAMGLGLIDQILQTLWDPVMGKVTVLVAIILFLQWKPGGLFATRSRSLEG